MVCVVCSYVISRDSLCMVASIFGRGHIAWALGIDETWSECFCDSRFPGARKLRTVMNNQNPRQRLAVV